jgi:hypothetical protein
LWFGCHIFEDLERLIMVKYFVHLLIKFEFVVIEGCASDVLVNTKSVLPQCLFLKYFEA